MIIKVIYILLSFITITLSIRLQLNKLEKPVNLTRDNKPSLTQASRQYISQFVKNPPPQLFLSDKTIMNITQFNRETYTLTNYNNLQYYGSLKIGTSKAPLTFIFDTGSNQLWFPTKGCTSCGGSTLYDTSSSTLYQQTSTERQTIQYGKGQVWGYSCKDQVWFGQTLQDVVNDYPCLAVNQEDDFSGTQADGILGLAPLMQTGQPPYILDILYQNGVISTRQISFRYTDQDSSDPSLLILGPYDQSLIKPTDRNVTLSLQNKGLLYFVELKETKFAGTSLGKSSLPALIDTGTSLIIAPQDAFNNLVSTMLKKYSNVYQLSGFLAIQCSELGSSDDMQITLESYDFKIPTSSLWFQYQNYCLLNIGGSNSNFWILGDTFIRDFYIVIDYDKSTVDIHGEKISNGPSSSSSSYTWWIVGGVVILLVIVGCAIGCCYCKKNRSRRALITENHRGYRDVGRETLL